MRWTLNRACRASLLFCAALTLGPGGGAAAREPEPVDLELVLAADISDSMDGDEQRLQRDGYVDAFRDPLIIEAIRSGYYGRIAVTFVEWADFARPNVIVPWRILDGEPAALAFADELARGRLQRMQRTSIAGALSFATHLIEENGFEGTRKVIDISGDGPNNHGGSVEAARDAAVARGIVINGLPILIDAEGPRGPFDTGFDKRLLDSYYRRCVIGGAGAFTLPVRTREELADGIRLKMFYEVSSAGDALPQPLPVNWSAEAPVRCEKRDRDGGWRP